MKGMYVGKLDLDLQNNGRGFYNATTKRSLENNLKSLTARLNSKEVQENEMSQLKKTQEDTEKKLKELHARNEFSNRILPLTESMREDPGTLSMIEAYKAKFPDPAGHVPPKP
jgi:uncharacterized membrane-anchored protein YjiN (DUF445 family)